MLTVTYSDPASPLLARLVRELGPDGKALLHEAAALQVSALVQMHLSRLALVRHATANRLGAKPTGHLSQAAESVAHVADRESGRVTVASPGLSRAFRANVIRPVRARALTIAIHALSYGRTVAEVKRERPVFRPKGKDYLATTEGEGRSARLVVLYLLRGEVRQPQDRTLMPSDQDLEAASRKGIRDVVQQSIRRLGFAA